MQGATSDIINLGDGWVRKQLTRKSKRSNKITPIAKQIEIHQWSTKTLRPENGFVVLFTPMIRMTGKNNSYEMEKIDDSNPIEKVPTPLRNEIIAYFTAAKASGYYPSDFELYLQPDGRIALLDFDKYGIIRDRLVTFPFRGVISLNHEPIASIFNSSLVKDIRNIMKGGHRKIRRRKNH
jgi:hypothetical protein